MIWLEFSLEGFVETSWHGAQKISDDEYVYKFDKVYIPL